jgi:hypothetical protein
VFSAFLQQSRVATAFRPCPKVKQCEIPTTSATTEIKVDEKCRARLEKFVRPGERYSVEFLRPGEIVLRKLAPVESKPSKARVVSIGGRKYLTNDRVMTNEDVRKALADEPDRSLPRSI